MRVWNSGTPRPGGACVRSAPSRGARAAVALPKLRHSDPFDVPAHPSYSQEPAFLWLPSTPQEALLAREAPDLRPAALPRPPVLACEAASAAAQASPVHVVSSVERGTFQVQLHNEPPQQKDKQKRADYYANVGDAIRSLRDDIPLLFAQELNYDIYREDIVFSQSTLNIKGLKNYKLIFWSLRFHGRLFFSRLTVDVVRIWQPEDSVIKMRWRVHGVPRVWWKAEGTFDGISTYKLDKEGCIYQHSVDNIELRDPPITNPWLYALNYLRPRLQPHQMPVPGGWFTDEPESAAATTVVSAQADVTTAGAA